MRGSSGSDPSTSALDGFLTADAPTPIPSARARPAPGPRAREPEGRGRQDHDGDQSRHRACGDRREGADPRPRPARQRLDRARHRPQEPRGSRPTTCSPGRPSSRAPSRRPRCRGSIVAPSTLDLLGVELEIAHERNRAHRLQQRDRAPRRRAPAPRPFTYVLIDCPPSLNLLTINALTAADAVLVPLQCEFFALEGLSQLLQHGRAGARVAQPAPHDPRHRAHHVRPAQQPLRPGRRRCAPVHGREGLRDHDPAQRAGVGGAVARQAGAALRPEMRRARRPICASPREIIQRERALRAA